MLPFLLCYEYRDILPAKKLRVFVAITTLITSSHSRDKVLMICY